MKSNGLRMNMSESGQIGFTVNTPSNVEDAVWEAVELAIATGWTPEQFRNEVADAWRDRLSEDAKHAVNVLSR